MSSRWPPLSKSNEPDLKINMLLTSVLGVKRSISHWHLAIAAIIASLVAVLPGHRRVVTAVEPVDKNGHVCVYLYGTAHVLVDVNGLVTS